MQTILIFLLSFICSLSIAQTTITGRVIGENKEPIAGVNVYIEGSYDGALTSIDGYFSFTTTQSEPITITASLVGYETITQLFTVGSEVPFTIRFRESLNQLNTVILSAGTLSAGDNSRVSALSSMDVVTTASAAGDFIGALQTLPGTSASPDDGRLFVRGGNAEETQIFIDGTRVFSPFTPTTGNIPTRSRFSPFLFDGINFSTGGYSAAYGDALSGILTLETTDFPVEEKTEIGIMTVGLQAANTQIWERNSLSISTSYINLAPYNAVIQQNNDFIKPFSSIGGEAVYRHKTTKGLLKAYGAYSGSQFSLQQQDINNAEGLFFGLNNGNYYGNLNYENELNNNWTLTSGLGLTHDKQRFTIAETKVKTQQNALNAKINLNKFFTNYFKIDLGVEHFLIHYNEDASFDSQRFENGITTNNTSTYAEASLFLSKKIAFKTGARADYYGASNTLNISPRFTAAASLNNAMQLSAAYGLFKQQGALNVLQYDASVTPEQSEHYILNFLYNKNKRMLRAEVYRKNYDDLITYNTIRPEFNSIYTNSGNGYAQGLDLFWRDPKSIKNLDYWVSYSYVDTQRKYRNFPTTATPSFVTNHNLSLVGKKFINSLRSQAGFTYSIASGRSYTNPNSTGFLNEKTKAFQSLDFNWAYLIDNQKILYFSVSNILGNQNVFGYQYSNTPDSNNVFNRIPINQAADRFAFIGFFWTLGGTDNQLDNL